MKRIIALIIAVLLVLPFCFSVSAAKDLDVIGDVDGDGRITLRDSAIFARYIANWEGYNDDGTITYPGKTTFISRFSPYTKVDFGAREFKFAVRTEWWSGVSSIELAGKTGTNIENSMTGNGYTRLSSKSAEMIKFLEDTYNCKIKVETFSYQDTSKQLNAITADTFAGIHTYDFSYDMLKYYSSYVPAGLFADLSKLDNINLNADYFDKSLNDEITLFGKTFYAMGAAETATIRNINVLVAKRANISSYTGKDPVNLVKNGQWTLDEFWNELVAINDSKNFISLYGSDSEFGFSLYSALGGNYTYKEEDGTVKFYQHITEDPFIEDNESAWQKFQNIFTRKSAGGVAMFSASSNTKDNLISSSLPSFQMYTLGRLVKDASNMNGAVILPLPKLNESSSYISNPYFRRTAAYAIPSTSFGVADATQYKFRNGAEMNAFLLSAMFNEAKNIDLRGACIDDIVNASQFKTYEAENREMIDIIISSRKLNLGQYLDCSGISVLTREAFHDVPNNLDTIDTRYRSNNNYYNISVKGSVAYNYEPYCGLDIMQNTIKNLTR